jgi:hypothetical protein
VRIYRTFDVTAGSARARYQSRRLGARLPSTGREPSVGAWRRLAADARNGAVTQKKDFIMLKLSSRTIVFSQVLTLVLIAGCGGGSGSTPSAGATCTLSSDCQSPLVCSASRCHAQCAETRDCDYGQRCVKLGTSFLCQFQSEAKCVYNSDCTSPLICAVDLQCRAQCQADRDCAKNQVCTSTTKVCAERTEVNAGGDLTPVGSVPPLDGSTTGGPTDAGRDGPADVPQFAGPDVPAPGDPVGQPDGGSLGETGIRGTDGGPSNPDGRGNLADVAGNSNPSPQTQFGFTVQGDSNPNFYSGIGVRAQNQMVIFSGYSGPDPTASPDAGTPARVNYVYMQAFDPISGSSKGSAVPFFDAKNFVPGGGANKYLNLVAAAVAPTGEIILLYEADATGIHAAFLGNSSGSAGANGLQLNRIVQVEVATIGHQPNCTWANGINAFACSWQYGSGSALKIRKFFPDGRPAGGDVDQVPTDSSNDSTYGGCFVGMGSSGSRFGVGYYSAVGGASWMPRLTILDTQSNQLGSPLIVGSEQSRDWVAVAGTENGLIAFYNDLGIGATFVPIGADGTVSAATSVDAGARPGFHFAGSKSALVGRAINDDVGGVGGAGLALLYDTGVSFAYVQADGSTHVGPGTVISHSYATGDVIEVTNFGGSFGVSLYSVQSHSTQMASTSSSP